MRLGYNTNGFSSHSLVDALEVIASIGYRSVGLTVDHHALNPLDPGNAARMEGCAEQLRNLNLVPVVETGARFLLDPWRKHRPNLMDAAPEDRLRRAAFLKTCVEMAVVLGADCVSLWSGACADEADQATLDRRLVDALGPVCDAALEAGIAIAFEPEPGMHIESMGDYDRIRAAIDHPAFALTLDLGHAYLTEDSVEQTIADYAPQIRNVHVEGMRRPHHEHLVPWDSGFDVRAALATLVETGYLGPATLELSRNGHQAVDVAQRAYSFLAPDAHM